MGLRTSYLLILQGILAMKTALIFPGQGSQSVGMMREFLDDYPLVTQTFIEASDVLGYDLLALCLHNSDDKLNQTQYTQPALLAASVATYRVLIDNSHLDVSVMAGHSLGEFSALVCAGSLAFSDAVSLVADRGAFMQAAVPAGTGAMVAVIGLADDDVIRICRDAAQGDVLSPANYNSIGQVVVAGSAAAIDRFIPVAEAAGARMVARLPVSVPSHCALMEPASKQLADTLANVSISPSTVPVFHNVNATAQTTPSAIKEALIKQLFSPVRWVDTINAIRESGVERCIEVGPGRVLTGLNKRIDKTLTTIPLNAPSALEKLSVEGE